MKRAVVFAHYDKDNIIDDYVVYYLTALKKTAEYIVFVSCCDLPQSEVSKLDGLCGYVIAEKHDEYDFGSYKRGFVHLKSLGEDFDEIAFINDSCYGPFFDLMPVFNEMTEKECDFWGLTINRFGFRKKFNRYIQAKIPHVQSYFIVIKKNVLVSETFTDFLLNVKHESDKKDIIMNYELGLTQTLEKAGFRPDSYIKKYFNINNSPVLKWRALIKKCNMPLLKCSLPRLVNRYNITVDGYEEIITSVSSYPVELIRKNVERTGIVYPEHYKLPVRLRRLVFDILIEMPYFLRRCCVIAIKKFFPIFLD